MFNLSLLGRYCYMILPIAALLAVVAADVRTESSTRKRCIATLESMRPAHFVSCGLAADYMAEVMTLLRQVFEGDFDLATLRQHLDKFISRLDKLFIQCHILDKAPGGLENQTCTYLAVQNARTCPPIQVGQRVFHFWPKDAPITKDVKPVMQGIQTSVNLLVNRLRSEILKDDIKMDLSVFDFYWWHLARVNMATDRHSWSDFEAGVKTRIARLLVTCGIPKDQIAIGTTEYFQAGSLLYEKHSAIESTCFDSPSFDNRATWADSLTKDFQAKATQNSTFVVLPAIVAFYLSIEASSCQNERDLGLAKTISNAQCGANQSTSHLIGACLELIRDGPQSEEDVCTRPLNLNVPSSDVAFGTISVAGIKSAPNLLLTNWSRSFFQLWRLHNGARFHLYKSRVDKGKLQGHRKFSEASLVSAQSQGRNQILNDLGEDVQLFGTTRASLVQRRDQKLDKSPVWNDAFENVLQLSKSRAKQNEDLKELRQSRSDPYPVGSLRIGNIFQRSASSGSSNGAQPIKLKGVVINLCKERITPGPCTVFQPTSDTKTPDLLARLQMSQCTIIVDCVSQLDYSEHAGLPNSIINILVGLLVCFII